MVGEKGDDVSEREEDKKRGPSGGQGGITLKWVGVESIPAILDPRNTPFSSDEMKFSLFFSLGDDVLRTTEKVVKGEG